MLEFIKNAIQAISTFFTSVWQIITGLVEDIVYTVKLLGDIVVKIPSFFSYLPPAVLSILIISIGVVVIYKIMGRTS